MKGVLSWLGLSQEIEDNVLKKILEAVENAQDRLNKIDTNIVELEASQSLEEGRSPRIKREIEKLQLSRRVVYMWLKEKIDSIIV